MTTIPANDIKRHGVTSITDALKSESEATISVHGKNKFVVMSIEHYQHLRECELEAALFEVRTDREAGRIASKTVTDHIDGLKNG